MDCVKLKVMTVIGTRPEIIRLSRIIPKLDEFCDHLLVHTGQNYDFELNEIFFRDLGLRKPDVFLEVAGASAAETIGKVIIAVDQTLAKHRPEALLILGDTNSCLAVIAAKRRRIPVFHMEAGNRSFDERVPEEINRRIIDHTADINLTYSTIARDYLIREGIAPDRIIKTGSPMFEVLTHYQPQIQASTIRKHLGLIDSEYFVVSAHREENIDSEINFGKLVEMLNAVASRYEQPIVFSTHPRTQKRIEATGASFHACVRLIKPLGFCDYINLQIGARAVLSDSGTLTEEASILGLRALNIREAHERPEGMEEGTAMMVGLDADRVLQGLAILDQQPSGESRTSRIASDYNVPNVSDKVVRIIQSYRDYVERVVWRTNR